MPSISLFSIRVSTIRACALAVAAAAVVALALPANVAARGGGGGGHGGGHGGGGGGHMGGGHMGGGGAHFAHIGGAHFSGARIGRTHFAAHSFSHIGRSRTISGSRFSHVNRVGRVGAGSHLTRANFAARVHARTNARASFARGAFVARGARWNGRADWWRHRAFFGWAGPLFWPYFYDDLWSDVFWSWGPDYYDDPFWAYGYGDIYGALFSPYGYGGLAGWAPASPQHTGSIARNAPSGPANTPTQWNAMCGGDTAVVDLPIDKISTAVAPNEQQRAALDALANASVQAAQLIKSACPSDVAYTPTGRMAAMEHRVQAMVQAVALIRDPLDKFYDSLTDEQKARLNGLNLGDAEAPRATASTCGPNAAPIPTWPQAQIEKVVQPTETQQPLLAKLKDASAKAVAMLKAACPTAAPATPPARLAAVAKRLDALLDAVKLVHTALDDFYGSLSDEQKAQFNGIAPLVQNGPGRR